MKKTAIKWLVALLCLVTCSGLHPIIFATTAESPEYVFGPDGRINITNTRTLFYPAVVKIYVNGEHSGTGSMVARDVVLTSAHVVENATSPGAITVVPGEMGNQHPYGESVAIQFIISPNYRGGRLEYDYATIKLASPLGDRTGFLRLSTNINVGSFAQSAGYPSDRAGMVYTSGNILRKDNLLRYTFDTYGGQSGSPVLNSDGKIIGVHRGYDSQVKPTHNIAAPITQEVVNLINATNPSSGAVGIDNTHIEGQVVYRLYNDSAKKHHFTSDRAERDQLVRNGWRDEGSAWRTGGVMPVYRLYNADTNDHLFTTSMQEVQNLQVRGWKNEGVAFQSGNGAPVYRLYHSGTLKHFYTQSDSEKNHLISVGWNYEGIAFKEQ